MGDRAFASATELSDEIRDRHIGCFELLDFYLARAERHNPALNAIVVWQVDQARERARAADVALARGERWGPLHGIPMTVKESFLTLRACRRRLAIRFGRTTSPPATPS